MPQPRPLRIAALALCALVLAACTDVAPDPDRPAPTDRSAGPERVTAALQVVADSLGAVAAALEADPAGSALASLPPLLAAGGVEALLARPVAALEPFSGAASPQEATPLPRGNYRYDESSAAWTRVGDAPVLALRWSADGGVATATVDWSATSPTATAADPPSDARWELPTGSRGRVELAGAAAASTELRVDWPDGTPCGAPGPVVAVPDGATLDATVGAGGLLALEDVGYELTPDGVAARGRVVARLPAGSGELSWEVAVQVPVTRDPSDCEPRTGAVEAAELVLAGAVPAGSLRTVVRVGGIERDGDGAVVSVDLDGWLEIDRRTVLTFAGPLADDDGDGVPGDRVALAYGDGSGGTLEELLRRVPLAGYALRGPTRRVR